MSVRWAFIGAGRHVQLWLAPAMAVATGTELVGVWSRQVQHARTLADRYHIAKAYTSIDDVLADNQVDAVLVATPNSQHAAHSLAALRARKHVLCEKPMATNVEDAVSMVRAAKVSGVQLGVGFHLRHNEIIAEARKCVAAGELGEIAYIAAQFNLASSRPPRLNIPHAPWKRDPDQMGGAGALMGMGVHLVDLVRFLVAQEVATVTALAVGGTREQPLESFAQVLLEFTGGTQGHIVYGGRFPLSRNDVTLYGNQGRLTAEQVVDVVASGVLEVATPDGPASSRAKTWRPELADNYQREIEAFNRAVETGQPVSASGLDGLRSVEITTAIIESQRTGQRVPVCQVEP